MGSRRSTPAGTRVPHGDDRGHRRRRPALHQRRRTGRHVAEPLPSEAGKGSLGGLVAPAARRPAVVLSRLQERIARILADLPEAREFALAGGAALIAGGLVDRETRDLDFFADRPAAVSELLPVLEGALRQSGLQVDRQQAHGGFARLGVTDGTESTEVDLCYDVRVRSTET